MGNRRGPRESSLTALVMLRGLLERLIGQEVGFQSSRLPFLKNVRRSSMRIFPKSGSSWCDAVGRNRHRRCRDEWLKLAADVQSSGKLVIRTCHAGLRQASIPLKVGNEIVGYIQCVTAVPVGEGGSFVNARKLVGKTTPPKGGWHTAYNRLSSLNTTDLIAVLEIARNIAESVLGTSLASSVAESASAVSSSRELLDRAGESRLEEHAPAEVIAAEGAAGGEAFSPAGLIMRAKNHIQHQYASRLSRNELASALGCSPLTLSRRFKKETGFSIPVFVNRLRIERAKELLAKSALPVASIAQKTGFMTRRNFHVFFRKETGNSPLNFRRKALV